MTDSRVHVVDDAKEVRDALTLLMESVGLMVSTYSSAAEFLDNLANSELTASTNVFKESMLSFYSTEPKKFVLDEKTYGSSEPYAQACSISYYVEVKEISESVQCTLKEVFSSVQTYTTNTWETDCKEFCKSVCGYDDQDHCDCQSDQKCYCTFHSSSSDR